ncbi:MAG: hypothetical protein JWN04_2273 [Myxococcaceae bacterium]|nr:hypothetical protein [Myxococcaceae bacterium]
MIALCCLSLLACSDIEHYSLGEPAIDAGAQEFDAVEFERALASCFLDAGASVDAAAVSFNNPKPEELLRCIGSTRAPIESSCPVNGLVICALKVSGIADKYHIMLPP